jgi:hypothetical protein
MQRDGHLRRVDESLLFLKRSDTRPIIDVQLPEDDNA